MSEPSDPLSPEDQRFPVVRNEQDFYSYIESRLREDGLELVETSPRKIRTRGPGDS